MNKLTSTHSCWAVLGHCINSLAQLSSSGNWPCANAHCPLWVKRTRWGKAGWRKGDPFPLSTSSESSRQKKGESRTDGHEDITLAEQMRGWIVWHQVRGRTMPQRALKWELRNRRELHLLRSLFTLALIQFWLIWAVWSSCRYTQSKGSWACL